MYETTSLVIGEKGADLSHFGSEWSLRLKAKEMEYKHCILVVSHGDSVNSSSNAVCVYRTLKIK